MGSCQPASSASSRLAMLAAAPLLAGDGKAKTVAVLWLTAMPTTSMGTPLIPRFDILPRQSGRVGWLPAPYRSRAMRLISFSPLRSPLVHPLLISFFRSLPFRGHLYSVVRSLRDRLYSRPPRRIAGIVGVIQIPKRRGTSQPPGPLLRHTRYPRWKIRQRICLLPQTVPPFSLTALRRLVLVCVTIQLGPKRDH